MKSRIEIDQHLENTFMPYAMATIVDRALPDIDGLKPVHRKILYAMHNKGLTFNKQERAKSTEPVSETMKIHGHGDSSIYEALALMTEQNETLLHPFIDGEGAFGKIYSKDSPAAPRYTFCKLNKFSEEMFDNIHKGVVDFIEEGGHKQPLLLPCSFPNILIKPNNGIAVGEACNFPSFNLIEVCNATKAMLKDSEVDLSQFISSPDFSTGGALIENKAELQKVIETGLGSFVIRSAYTYNESENCIDIYEIPYSTTADSIIDKITQIIRLGKMKDIIDIRDETGWDNEKGKEELRITIDLKKKADPEMVMDYLFKNSPLESSFSVNMNSVYNNVPKVRGVRETLKLWIAFRRNCVKKALTYDLEKYRKEYVLLKGLEIVSVDIDKVVSIIRQSKTEEESIQELKEKFALSETQANYIADIKLRYLNKDYISKKLKRLEEVIKIGKDISSILEDETKLNDIISQKLDEIIAEYGQPRRTVIISSTEEKKVVSKQEIIEDYNCHIMLTKQGYVKKYLRYADEESHKLKDEDSIVLMTPTVNKSDLIIYTDKANCYTLPVHKLEQTAPSSLGTYIKNTLNIDKEEEIIFSIITTNYEGWLLFTFENGKVAKIPLASYKSTRTKLTNAYNQNSPIVSINYINEDKDFVIASSIDKYLIFNTNQINEKVSRNSQGVQVIKSKKDSITAKCYPLDLELEEKTYQYYKGNIPAVGTFLRKEDSL